MAQRRSRNRRSSNRLSINNSNVLNDDTNIVDQEDRLWYDRSTVRPSTSLVFTKNASSILSPDSTANTSQLSSKWYKNLTQSDSSKLAEESVKNKSTKQKTDETTKIVESSTESESEHESQKKRAKFGLNKKKKKLNKSNAFLKALEKTTDSDTRNLTSTRLGHVNDSESTNDDSRTMKGPRPRIFQTKKPIPRIEENNFEDIFNSSGVSSNKSNNKTKSNTIYETPTRKSQSRIINETPSTNNSQRKSPRKRPALFSQSQKNESKRSKINDLFDEELDDKSKQTENQSKTEKSKMKLSFALSSDEDENLEISLNKNTSKINKPEESRRKSSRLTSNMAKKSLKELSDEEGNVSDVPQTGNETSMANKSKESQRKSLRQKSSQAMKSSEELSDKEGNISDVPQTRNETSMIDEPEESRRKSSRLTSSMAKKSLKELSDEEENVSDVPQTGNETSVANKSKESRRKSLRQKSSQATKSLEELSDEEGNISDVPQTRNETPTANKSEESRRKSSQATKSSEELSDEENSIYDVSKTKSKTSMTDEAEASQRKSSTQKSNQTTKSSQELSDEDDSIYDAQKTKSDESMNGEPEALRELQLKMKTRKSNTLKQIDESKNEKSKVNKSKQSQRQSMSPNSSKILQISSNKSSNNVENKSIVSESVANDTEDSTMPKYIRRTKSRLFPRPDDLENNDEEVFVDVESVDNDVIENLKQSLSQKSTQQITDRSLKPNENISKVNEHTGNQNSELLKTAQVVLERISHGSSNESHKENYKVSEKQQKNHTINSSQKDNRSINKTLKESTIDKSRKNDQTTNASEKENQVVDKSQKKDHTFNKSQKNDKTINVSQKENQTVDKDQKRDHTINKSKKKDQTINQSKPSANKSSVNKTLESKEKSITQYFEKTSESSKKSEVNLKNKTIESRTLSRSPSGESLQESKSSSTSKNSLSQNEKTKSFTKSKKADSSANITKNTVSAVSDDKERTSQKSRSSISESLEESDNDNRIDNVSNRVERSKNQTKSIRDSNRANSTVYAPQTAGGKTIQSERSKSVESSVDTSNENDQIPISESQKKQNKSTQKRPTTSDNTSSRHLSILSDNMLPQTPNPAQSTLNPRGKPINRMTQFFSDSPSNFTTAQIETPLKKSTPKSTPNISDKRQKNKDTGQQNEDNDQPQDNDVIVDAGVMSYNEEIEPLEDQEDLLNHPFFRKSDEDPMTFRPATETNDNLDKDLFAKLKKKTDAMNAKAFANLKRKEEIERQQQLKKDMLDKKINVFKVMLENQAKRKNKKPIDKAYLVNGVPYKQPRLPRPANWATDRLYKLLWRCMEPKYGPQTRVQSEKFVQYLSKASKKIEKLTVYDNYCNILNDLLIKMAKYKIIETRYDFYRFCSDYMPYKFRIKVVPMKLPNNKRNIPYNSKLTFEPIIIRKKHRNREGESESESESGSEGEPENK